MTAAIPVEVRYQHSKNINQLAAYADAHGLESLAGLLRSDQERTWDLTAQLRESAVGDGTILKHVRIVPSETPVDIQVEGDTVVIRGDHASRDIVAHNITFLRLQEPAGRGADIHFDYLPGCSHLLPQTKSLVVVRL